MPTSESVWFEEVDTALIKYIGEQVKLFNSDTDKDESVTVTIRKPDEDFKIEVYPSISIYCTGARRDERRFYDIKKIVGRNSSDFTFTREEPAIPYNLNYQIDFWSKLQTQQNEMLRKWIGHTPDKYINLPLFDVSGNPRNSFMLQRSGIYKSDILSGESRIFHSTISYLIWVELDERVSASGGHYVNSFHTTIKNLGG